MIRRGMSCALAGALLVASVEAYAALVIGEAPFRWIVHTPLIFVAWTAGAWLWEEITA